jgi:putative ABC transport system permease protein
MFSVVDALVLRPLPYAQPEDLVTIRTQARETGRLGPVSFPDMAYVREQSGAFSEIALYRPRGLVMSGSDAPETLNAVIASATLWKVLGARPALGRALAAGPDWPPSRQR